MHGHQPRKRFGQNFLADPHYVARIVDAVAPQPGDRLVEIGPGLAALTRPLIERAGHLDAVEIDRDLAARLASDFPPAQLTLHVADALAFDFATLGRALRIVGNLPYNISSPLLFHLAQFDALIVDVHVMLQKEVVARMTASPATPEYGRLTVMLQVLFGWCVSSRSLRAPFARAEGRLGGRAPRAVGGRETGDRRRRAVRPHRCRGASGSDARRCAMRSRRSAMKPRCAESASTRRRGETLAVGVSAACQRARGHGE